MRANSGASPSEGKGAAEAEEPCYFPAFLDLRGRTTVVVGGGRVAARRVQSLLTAGAFVRVIAPQVGPEMRSLLERPRVTRWERGYLQDDLVGGVLVFAASDNREVNEAVHRDALALGILVNLADDPDHCSFIVPSRVTRDGICIAITTQGQSPALARRLRERIEVAIPSAYGQLARLLGRLRPEVQAALPSSGERAQGRRAEAARRRRWEAVLESPVLSLIEQGRGDEAEVLARSLLGLPSKPEATST